MARHEPGWRSPRTTARPRLRSPSDPAVHQEAPAPAWGPNRLPIPSPCPAAEDWYGNLLWFDRRKCLLLTHAGTLFSVFKADLRAAGLRDTQRLVTGLIARELAREGLPHATLGPLDRQELIVARTADRSVLGCMNDMAVLCEHATASPGLHYLCPQLQGVLRPHRPGYGRHVRTPPRRPRAIRTGPPVRGRRLPARPQRPLPLRVRPQMETLPPAHTRNRPASVTHQAEQGVADVRPVPSVWHAVRSLRPERPDLVAGLTGAVSGVHDGMVAAGGTVQPRQHAVALWSVRPPVRGDRYRTRRVGEELRISAGGVRAVAPGGPASKGA